VLHGLSKQKKTAPLALTIAGVARRSLLQRGGAAPGPFPRCSARPRRAPIRLACHGRGGRGGQRLCHHPPRAVGKTGRPARP